MQLVQTQRDTLLRPLQIVSGIVERRHTLPILANILVRKQGEEIAFVATDIEIQITTRAAIGAGKDDASTTVAARKLLDILRALPGGDVKLTLADKKLGIDSGKSRFKLQTLPAEDFPVVNTPDKFIASFSMPEKTLKRLFAQVHFAMAQQDIRYYLNGLLLVTGAGRVSAVATDGHRLAFATHEIEGEVPKADVIIPRKTILELQRLLGDGEEAVKIEIAQNQIRFTFGEIELISKLVEGKFPDYQRVIPSGYTKNFAIRREELLHSLQRAAILTSDKFKGVRLSLQTDALSISSTNAEQEDALEELEIAWTHEPLDIGFNVSYLLDVLNNLKNETVQVALGDANSSALLTLPEDESFKYVVMPMRI
ncbi:DNA polymerase III subunit beta [Derxia lacustris]|uniref:DNA polymerase III subunit beta n=1 Tax=Derxia lacustris TaxID=764842 RepID=UPI000A16D57B|nr:DNA polymerase III subunit beta [Derxia lacustris]